MNSTSQPKFRRISDRAGDGYGSTDGRIKIWDNGGGFGSVRNSGRWALEVDGRWVANIDTLADAKQRGIEQV